MESYINSIFNEITETVNKFIGDSAHQLIEISTHIATCFESGGKLMIFGNGGSAADAQHIAAEFVNRFQMERPSLPAIALTTDTSVLTSIGNDYNFNDIFEKQLMALAKPGDIAWGISTSGNSENVLKGLRFCAREGIKTFGFAGRDGGKMNGLSDLLLIAPSETTARIQEIHIMAAHIICGLVDELLFGIFNPDIME